MVSYRPLWHTLVDRGLKKMQLVEMAGISTGTLSKLNKDQHVALDVLERICLALDCRIEDVVEITKGPDELTSGPSWSGLLLVMYRRTSPTHGTRLAVRLPHNKVG